MSDKCPFAWGRLVHRNWRVWGLQSVEAGQSSAAEFRAAPRNYASALFVTVRHWIKSQKSDWFQEKHFTYHADLRTTT